MIAIRRWANVRDTLELSEPDATSLNEQGPSRRTEEEGFRNAILELGEGLPCPGLLVCGA